MSPTTPQPTANTRFVVLRGLDAGNVFWSMYDPMRDTPHSIVRLATGEVVYEVLAYCDTDTAAQAAWRVNYSAVSIDLWRKQA